MSFDDAAARLRKITTEKEKAKAEAETAATDLSDVYTLRARMLGVLIRDARIASGYTVEEVADELGVTPDAVLEWEFGRFAPSLPQLELLAYMFQIPISHFWGTETLTERQNQRRVDTIEYQNVRDHMIGVLIRAKREEYHMTVEQVAAKVDVPAEAFALYEVGRQPVPMTVLVTLSSFFRVTLSYFLDDAGRVGEFFELQEAIKTFSELPADIRAFLASHTHQEYVRLAMILAEQSTDTLRGLAEGMLKLREFAETLLDITL